MPLDDPMANEEHVAMLKQGVAAWNKWRGANPDIEPNLSEADLYEAYLDKADLREANLRGADLRKAKFIEEDLSRGNLSRANLREANFHGADLKMADLSGANLYGAGLYGADLRGANLYGAVLEGADLVDARLGAVNLSGADLCGADLCGADLCGADLREADLSGASLSWANLRSASLVNTNLTNADLTNCRIHGVSAWGLKLKGAKQENLIITADREPEITVDNIEVAQFIYLMLHNQKIRDVIDTITSKAVLILGRFTDERKPVLEALREELRQRKYLPILFDFEKPRSLGTDETITLLARMARFVVADISDAKSVLQELRAIVPDLPALPVQPIILAAQEEPGMFDFYRNRPSFLNVHRYASQEQLIAELGEKVIRPAELKVLDLQGRDLRPQA
jgi:uncharacterized protein YjbI with pentapeptide repeats